MISFSCMSSSQGNPNVTFSRDVVLINKWNLTSLRNLCTCIHRWARWQYNICNNHINQIWFTRTNRPNAAVNYLGYVDSWSLLDVKLCLLLVPNYYESSAEKDFLEKEKDQFLIFNTADELMFFFYAVLVLVHLLWVADYCCLRLSEKSY